MAYNSFWTFASSCGALILTFSLARFLARFATFPASISLLSRQTCELPVAMDLSKRIHIAVSAVEDILKTDPVSGERTSVLRSHVASLCTFKLFLEEMKHEFALLVLRAALSQIDEAFQDLFNLLSEMRLVDSQGQSHSLTTACHLESNADLETCTRRPLTDHQLLRLEQSTKVFQEVFDMNSGMYTTNKLRTAARDLPVEEFALINAPYSVSATPLFGLRYLRARQRIDMKAIHFPFLADRYVALDCCFFPAKSVTSHIKTIFGLLAADTRQLSHRRHPWLSYGFSFLTPFLPKKNPSLDSQNQTQPCNDPVVVYCGPNAGLMEQLQADCEDISAFLRNDVSVIAFNYRGYGYSDGKPSPQIIARDCAALIRYLNEGPPRLTRIGVYGRSIGGIAACGAAAANPECVKWLCVDRSFDHLHNLAGHLVHRSVSGLMRMIKFTESNVSKFLDFKGPKLCCYDHQDTIVVHPASLVYSLGTFGSAKSFSSLMNESSSVLSDLVKRYDAVFYLWLNASDARAETHKNLHKVRIPGLPPTNEVDHRFLTKLIESLKYLKELNVMKHSVESFLLGNSTSNFSTYDFGRTGRMFREEQLKRFIGAAAIWGMTKNSICVQNEFGGYVKTPLTDVHYLPVNWNEENDISHKNDGRMWMQDIIRSRRETMVDNIALMKEQVLASGEEPLTSSGNFASKYLKETNRIVKVFLEELDCVMSNFKEKYPNEEKVIERFGFVVPLYCGHNGNWNPMDTELIMKNLNSSDLKKGCA